MTRPALLLLALAACFAALASALLPAPGSAGPAPAAVGRVAAPAVRAEVYGGTAVSSTLDELSADRAFFADLFDGAATDLSPAQAEWMVTTAHRMCDLGQPRADWTASLTASGPYRLTADEAGKLFDVAHGAYCPQSAPAAVRAVSAPRAARVASPARTAAPRHTSAAPRPTAAPRRTAVASSAAPSAAPDAGPCPVGQEWQGADLGCVQPQLPEETQGRAIDPVTTDPCFRQDPECYATPAATR